MLATMFDIAYWIFIGIVAIALLASVYDMGRASVVRAGMECQEVFVLGKVYSISVVDVTPRPTSERTVRVFLKKETRPLDLPESNKPTRLLF